ncbi:ADYC domain-containing protein [Falsiroseomonas sp. HW251]|uniref:ADYC domain-containing protein n=1 Tax=Falsiroseomonas sp. HW251 TaxID=3390998 RepID=UPI003D31E96E
MRRLVLLLALLAALPAQGQPAPGLPMGLHAPGGELVAALPDGTMRRGADLAGATLDLGPRYGLLRIAEARPDRLDRTGETWLYDLRRQDPTGAWTVPACEPAHDGVRAVIFLEASPGALEPHCANVNTAKCIRMGYAPWRSAPDGRALAPFHQACLRMLPAEYAGDGRFHTRNGMRIEIFDFAGVNDPENEAGMPFEAGWTPDGAACVAHARVPEITDMAALAAAAPRLAEAGLLGPASCTEATARALGALVFNRSVAE